MSSRKDYVGLWDFFSAEPTPGHSALFLDDKHERLTEHWRRMQMRGEILITEGVSGLFCCFFSVPLFGSGK